jgi:TRAP transporter TAXI family solute receptor
MYPKNIQIINTKENIHMLTIRKIGLMLSLGAALVTSAALAQQQQFVNVLTGGQSGVYYPLGVALSQIYAKNIPNVRSTAQVTRASAENMNLLQAGRGEVALALADSVSDAYKGNAEAGFPKPLTKLRGLSATYNNYIQIVANADSGIKTLADLKGKRISVGAAKSGTELNARAIFKAAGLSYSDMAKIEYLPFGESVELMKNRQLDATLQSAGLGVASIRDLATSVKIVVVGVPADVVTRVGDAAYQPSFIPANTYAGQSVDIPTAAIPNFLVTHAGVSDELAYQMAKSLYDNIDTMYAAHNAAKTIQRENAVRGMPVPVHPGAARYYKEVGVMK